MEKLELIKNNLFIGDFISFAIFAILYFCAFKVGEKQNEIREIENKILIKQIEKSLNK